MYFSIQDYVSHGIAPVLVQSETEHMSGLHSRRLHSDCKMQMFAVHAFHSLFQLTKRKKAGISI